jgi:hypothetical protein
MLIFCLVKIPHVPLQENGRIKDASACDDPSSFLVVPEDVGPNGWPCDFPLIISGFGVEGLPTAANNTNTKNVGVSPSAGFYRVSSTDAPCDNVVDSYIKKGAGAYKEDPSSGTFSWKGNYVLLRPPGQVSFVPDIDPNGEGGIWAVRGTSVFESEYFTLLDFKGKIVADICQLLSN